ncbi:MAG: aquaporin family protein [Propionibacteriaceae bacterium]|jgi:glycerol uptake facilitator protein|nr:aquaporin family protein [Propionibacteriaceae bacterium]
MSEFLGTAMLILLGAGVCATTGLKGSKGLGAGWLAVNFGWGLAVFSGVLVAFQTGGHLNPAVTLGVAFSKLGTENPEFVPGVPVNAGVICIYILAQLLGAIVGAVLCYLTFFKQYNMQQDAGAKLGTFATGPAVKSPLWNTITEIVATFVLVFVVLVSGYQGNSGDLGWLNALGVAFLIVAIGVSLGGPTGYAINPARDLGPRIAFALLPMKGGKGSADWGYAWIPVFGPIIGGLIAGAVFIGYNAIMVPAV